ncbi:hypothetical protein AYO39_00645 [Actinobacteria bacterium SCGC AG-212-D09]|nr:hypothetical protein AYO39_00645 [Actinobacteria bacterium SCGC AG-212-D09]
MHEAFGTVLWVVCIGAAIAAVIGLISTRRTWDDFGKSRLLLDSDLSRGHSHASSPASLLERDEDIRQMLEARNARRARRGEPPIDVEQELAKLTAPRFDAQLEAEIRQLVIARNYRRTRAGKPALDVDAEVEREIRQLAEV